MAIDVRFPKLDPSFAGCYLDLPLGNNDERFAAALALPRLDIDDDHGQVWTSTMMTASKSISEEKLAWKRPAELRSPYA